MTFPAHALSVETFTPMLRTLSALLDKGAEHARSRGADPETLIEARLAPDMYTLAQQVQQACAYATDGVARLVGREPPAIEAPLASLADLKAHIAEALDYLDVAPVTAFADAGDRRIVRPLSDDLVLDAAALQYLRDWALPHFYFHLVTAYDILRANGVPIGKRDYLAHIGAYIRPRAA